MEKTFTHSKISRRQFLTATGAVIAFPTILPSSALGRGGATAPSERITMGVVGWGMQGPGNTDQALKQKDCQVVASCNIDKNHLKASLDTINGHYKNQDCKGYHDYREMMARTDIDAVMLAVPDHWHALLSTEAANHKKDIYGEKPLARTIAEQQAIVKAVQKNQRIWQTGSWQRSQAPMRKAAEIVRNGLIGKITHVEVGLPEGHTDFAKTSKEMQPSDPPPELDYDFWIGPSHMEPYIKGRVHQNWRWNYNTGGGQLLDWIGHHCDIAHWGLGMDNSGGPIEIEGTGEFPMELPWYRRFYSSKKFSDEKAGEALKDPVWNTCTKYRITASYPGDITMTIAGGYPEIKMGAKWIGTDGWVWVNRNEFDASKIEWFQEIESDEKYKVHLYKSNNHMRNFLDCIKSRKPSITPVETAHHSAIPGHLGLIAMLVGRKIRWDSTKEVIVGDADASKFLTRPYRAPWKLH